MEALVVFVAAMSVAALGASFMFFGTTEEYLRENIAGKSGGKLTNAESSSFVSAFFFSCAVASLVVGVLIDAIGYTAVLTAGFLIVGACMITLVKTRSYSVGIIASIAFGPGAMAVCVGGNSLFPRILFGGENPAAASNLGNAFFGMGLMLFPLLVSLRSRETNAGLRTVPGIVSIFGAVVILMALPTLLGQFPDPQAGFAISSAFALLTQPAVLLSALSLLCYIALESTFCMWLPRLSEEVSSKVDPQGDAGRFGKHAATAFALAMIASRLSAAFVPVITQYGSYAVAALGVISALVIFGLTTAKGKSAVIGLALVAGAAFGPCFPTIVGITFSKFEPGQYGSIFGIAFAIGLVGAIFVPNLLGKQADRIAAVRVERESEKTLFQQCLGLLMWFALGLTALVLLLGITPAR